MFFWLSLIIFIISLAGIIAFFARHYTDLLILNAETIKKPATELRKEQILEERIRRIWGDRFRAGARTVRKIFNFLRPRFKIFWERMLEIQRRAEEQVRLRFALRQVPRKPGARQLIAQEKAAALLDEGYKELGAKNYVGAEGKFIDIIRLNPKNPSAYKGLAEVYLAKKAWTEAQETLEFLARLTPNDPNTYLLLLRTAEEGGEHKRRLEYLAKLIELDPNNPRYLDLLIETAIMLGNKRLSRQGLDRLRRVNPENKKIGEFEARITAIR